MQSRNPRVVRKPLTHREDLAWEERVGALVTPQPDGCWTWQGAHNQAGYATISQRSSRTTSGVTTVLVHRWIYETLYHRIPEGHHLHHRCENPGCVNPSHLQPLTPLEHRQAHPR